MRSEQKRLKNSSQFYNNDINNDINNDVNNENNNPYD